MFSAILLAFACSGRYLLKSMATVTHRIDDSLKAELDRFCEAHGLKQQSVVAEAIACWLEDAADLAEIEQRRGGPWVEWADVRKTL